MAGKQPTLLDKEATEIMQNSTSFSMPKIEATIHTKKDNITITHFTNLHVNRNFTTNISDILYAEFMVGLGVFRDAIYENREALEISIRLEFGKKTRENRYKFLLTTKFKDANNSLQTKHDTGTLDSQDLVVVRGQCVDPLVMVFKDLVVSGVYHNLNYDKLMKVVFSEYLADVKVRGRGLNYYLNIYKLDNQTVYRNLLIKPFSKLIKIPYALQHDGHGLYNHDAGIYFYTTDEKKFYTYDIDVYPMFDYGRFDAEGKRPKIIFISPSMPELGKNDFNFYYKNGIYKTVVTDISFEEEQERMRYDEGKGLIASYSTNTVDPNMYDVKEDTIEYFNGDAFDVFVTEQAGGVIDYTTLLRNELDDNLFRYYSRLNKNQGVIGIMKFPKVNPEFIYPGMPFKYMFSKEDKIVETTGTIQAVDHYYDFNNQTSIVVIVALFKRIEGS